MSYVHFLRLGFAAVALSSAGFGQVYSPLYRPSTGRTLNAYCYNLVSGTVVP